MTKRTMLIMLASLSTVNLMNNVPVICPNGIINMRVKSSISIRVGYKDFLLNRLYLRKNKTWKINENKLITNIIVYIMKLIIKSSFVLNKGEKLAMYPKYNKKDSEMSFRYHKSV